MTARPLAALAGAALLGAALAAQQPASEPLVTTTVGMRARIEQLVLPGTALRPRDVPDAQKAPVILRVLATWPHGTALRYDLEVTGLEPGVVDLREHLERSDGSSTADLPPLPVRFDPVLPLDRLRPNPVGMERTPALGGYTMLLIAGAVVWLAGLLAILFAGRGKRRRQLAAANAPPPTLADRLRPLVEAASRGELEPDRRAELERLILAHWRERLGLAGVKAGEAIARVRRHDEAGALLRRLETWLHSPHQPGDAGDLAELLRPYREPTAAPGATDPAGGA